MLSSQTRTILEGINTVYSIKCNPHLNKSSGKEITSNNKSFYSNFKPSRKYILTKSFNLGYLLFYISYDFFSGGDRGRGRGVGRERKKESNSPVREI